MRTALNNTLLLFSFLLGSSSVCYSQKLFPDFPIDPITSPVDFNLPEEPTVPTVDPDHPDIPVVQNIYDVGNSAGELTVSRTGAAQYQLAIDCPNGGGLNPQISLVYNSQSSGYGLAGYGFTVSGISSITRGGKRLFHDNSISGVTYTANDNLFLDGKRLILQSGSSCQEGAEYCLEGDPYTRVIAHGVYNDKTTNTWFEVKTADGKTYQYGNSQTSAINYVNKSGTPRIASWYINRVEDVYGNYMTYDYLVSELYAYLHCITYGLNSQKSRGITNKVLFNYLWMGNNSSFFNIEDQKGRISKCISSITTSCNDTIWRKYQLLYDSTSDQSTCKYTRLTSIREETGTGMCHAPIQLEWHHLPSATVTNNPIDVKTKDGPMVKESNKSFFAVDVNGDGVSDIIRLSYENVIEYNERKQGYEVYKTNVYISVSKLSPSGEITFKSPVVIQIPTPLNMDHYIREMAGLRATDLNGDGYNDLVFPYYNQIDNDYAQLAFWVIYGHKSSIAGVPAEPIYINTNASKKAPLIAVFDADGDGKDEFVCIEQSLKNGTFPAFIVKENNGFIRTDYSLSIPQEPKKLFCADYNNDGLIDIILLHNDGYKILFNNGGSDFSQLFKDSNSKTGTDLCDYWRVDQGDFDGDGLTDFVYNVSGETCLWTARNNGDGSFTSTKSDDVGVRDYGDSSKDDHAFALLVYDNDHDGKSDVMVCKANYTYHSGNIFSHSYYRYINTGIRWLYSDGTKLKLFGSMANTHKEDANEPTIFVGDFNGDGYAEVANYGSDLTNIDGFFVEDKINVYKNQADVTQSGKIVRITDSMGNKTSITYALATNPVVYTKTSSSSENTSPVNTYSFPLSVVRNVISTNGIAGAQTTEYSYKDLKVHVKGAGMLGFSETMTSNTTTGEQIVSTIEEYDQERWIPVKTKVVTTIGENTSTVLSNITIENVGNTYFAYESYNLATDMYGHTVATTSQYDLEKGVILNQKIENDGSDMYKEVKYADFVNKAGVWLPQIVTTKQKHIDDALPYENITKYNYDDNGNILTQILNYGQPLKLTNYFYYDVYGNCDKSFSIGKGVKFFMRHNDFDTSGRFVTKSYQYPSATVNMYTYDIWGHKITESDITNPENPLTTLYVYDGWGQMVSSQAPDGTKTLITIGWGDSEDKKYYALEKKSESPWKLTWYDNVGHEVLQQSFGPKNVLVSKTTEYDTKGLVKKVTNTEGLLSMAESFVYDELGRLSIEKLSSGSIVSYSYGDRTVTKAMGERSNTRKTDAWGNIVSSTDAAGTEVRYYYKSNGKPDRVVTNGMAVCMEYDEVGNQISLTDPDAGTITYEYAADGTLLKQTDARGIVTKKTYDSLGRLLKVKIGANVIDYTYGTRGNEKLQLTKMAMGGNSVEYQDFDKYGRPHKEVRTIAGEGRYEFCYHYDDRNRLDKTTYPGGLEVSYEYDDYGFKTRNIADGKISWHLGAYSGLVTETYYFDCYCLKRTKDNNGHNKSVVLLEKLRAKVLSNINSKEDISLVTVNSNMTLKPWNQYPGKVKDRYETCYDSITGNLLARQRDNHSVEVFEYDNLDRLTSVSTSTARTVTEHGQLTNVMNISYASNGNILSKTGIGNYTYNSTFKPHAVMSVDNMDGMIPSDALSTVFNDLGKIQSIENEDNSKRMDIVYGPNLERWYSSLTTDGQEERTTVYAGNYEKITENGVTREFYYLDGNTIIIKENGKFKPYLALTDNLGSILSVVDEDGANVFDASYDAWGQQTVTLNEIGLHRGYTGHEMLSEFGIINMNGRLYDPILGRFFSPDNYVQLPNFSQSFNRYSYCLNNPLKYTDPSGELFGIDDLILLGAAYGMYTSAMMAWGNGENPWKAAGVSLLSSCFSYGIGQMFGSIGNFGHELLRAGAHGLSSGVISVLSGESFGSGFLAGAISSGLGSGCQALNVDNRLMVPLASVAGGVAAWATGGDFLQGALQGMQIAVLNHSAHDGSGFVSYTHDSSGNIQGKIPEIVCTPDGTSAFSDYLSFALAINTTADCIGKSLKKNSGNSTVGSNGKFYFRNAGQRGFYGNKYVKTMKLTTIGNGITKVTGPLGYILSGKEIYDGYRKDEYQVGYHTARATADVAGGWSGAAAGAALGAKAGFAIGVWFGGVGAGPGALIGSVVGGAAGGIAGSFGGSWIGTSSVDMIYGY